MHVDVFGRWQVWQHAGRDCSGALHQGFCDAVHSVDHPVIRAYKYGIRQVCVGYLQAMFSDRTHCWHAVCGSKPIGFIDLGYGGQRQVNWVVLRNLLNKMGHIPNMDVTADLPKVVLRPNRQSRSKRAGVGQASAGIPSRICSVRTAARVPDPRMPSILPTS